MCTVASSPCLSPPIGVDHSGLFVVVVGVVRDADDVLNEDHYEHERSRVGLC